MKTRVITLAAVAVSAIAAFSSVAANAQSSTAETPWLVRARAVNLDPRNHDTTGLDLSINSKVIPEVDFTYFFTPEWAAELVLTVPQKQRIESAGTRIGSLKHLPPTLTVQYHLNTLGAFKPYVGAGVNYTRFSDVSFNPAVAAALNPSIDKNSFGGALQIGADYDLGHNLVLNFDIKKVQISTDIKSSGTKVGEFKVDPWLIGVGLGWRF